MLDFSCFSKYKLSLMGVAILWVMFYHLASQGNSFHFGLAHALLCIGDSGVDIFMFLSGIGLYHSFTKQNNLKVFYYKRFIRIVPKYIVVNLIVGFILGWSLENILINISTIGFWFNIGCYDWYIPTIMVFYLLFPINYKMIKRYGRGYFVVNFIIVLAILICTYLVDSLNFHDNRSFALSRWPIFLFGIYIGSLTYHKKETVMNNFYTLFFPFGGIFLMLLFLLFNKYENLPLYSGIKQLFHLFYIPGVCVSICMILSRFHLFNRILEFAGKLSLELYLIHFYIMIKKPFYFEEYSLICGFMYIILSFIFAWILNYCMSHIPPLTKNKIKSHSL